MSELLKKGFRVRTILGETVTVERHHNEEEQYNSYIVDYKQQEKILAWFKKEYLDMAPETLYKDLKHNLDDCNSSASKALRLLDITEYKNGAFGFVTDYPPEDYDDLIKEIQHYLETLEQNLDNDYSR